MDLKSGYPYWAVKNGLMQAFPPLRDDVACDVAIIGGGITGALVADELAAHGHEVVVVEQRDIGWGSSSASTALLQYEIDTHLVDLAKKYGEADALLAYRACADALLLLKHKAEQVRDVDFAWNDSLYVASKRRHVRPLQDEFALRERHGFDVEWCSRDALHERFGFAAPGGILSHQAARVDAYRFAHRLFERLRRNGVAVHDRTRVEGVQTNARGVVVTIAAGPQVRARHLIVAAGYAGQQWLRQRVAKNRSSYACITDPLEAGALGFLRRTQLWESARPYLYVRSTGDGRLLIGGEDDDTDVPARRDARVDGKAQRLTAKMKRLFPHLELEPAFAWAGTFAETRDGLPFFGAHAQYGPRVLFAMAYGGNGITYSMAGAGLLRALVERRKHPLARLLSFDRLKR